MMAMMHRQTISFLRQRLEEAGVRPDTRHGQNFLIDLNLVELLVNAADLDQRDVVLEVGTGTGSLTAMMAQRAAVVVTVELSAELHQLAREELVEFDNVVMLRQDALKNKNQLHPDLLAAVRSQLAVDPRRRLKLAANLPYNIATPVISNLLTTDIVPVSMTATIQKELADRITARPGSKDYGALSVWIQSQCHAEVLRYLPPTVFWPRPKVHSAIIQIVPQRDLMERIPDRPYFHRFVRSMFFHRRKFLRSVVLSAYKRELSKPQVDAVLTGLQLGPDARAEQLDVERMLELCERLRATVDQSAPQRDP